MGNFSTNRASACFSRKNLERGDGCSQGEIILKRATVNTANGFSTSNCVGSLPCSELKFCVGNNLMLL